MGGRCGPGLCVISRSLMSFNEDFPLQIGFEPARETQVTCGLAQSLIKTDNIIMKISRGSAFIISSYHQISC